jgi:predicted ATP-grasp superfamily ATP-dependent carboligase
MSPVPPTPVLLAGNSEYGTLAAVRALRAAGYAPWLAVDEPGVYAARSRATAGTVLVPDPKVDGVGFVREVAAAARRLSVRAVLPGGESYLLALAGRESDFASIALGVPPRESVERATDKALLPEFAAAAGLRTPPTVKVGRGDGEKLGGVGFPAIVKPRRNWVRSPRETVPTAYSMRYYPVRCVSSEEQAEEALGNLPGGEGLVQPHIPGQLVSVAGVSWEGKLYCALHQAAIRIWPPLCGGSAYAQTIPPDAELERGVGSLLRAIGWSGLFQAQFVRSPEGEHYLIDLNPRVYGTLALAVAAGMNLPVVWADFLLARRPNIDGYRAGVGFRNEENDARALVRMLMKGECQRALQGFVPRRGTTHAMFSMRDPMPLLTSLARLSRGRLARLSSLRRRGA